MALHTYIIIVGTGRTLGTTMLCVLDAYGYVMPPTNMYATTPLLVALPLGHIGRLFGSAVLVELRHLRVTLVFDQAYA